jgi:hypothetical protein
MYFQTPFCTYLALELNGSISCPSALRQRATVAMKRCLKKSLVNNMQQIIVVLIQGDVLIVALGGC